LRTAAVDNFLDLIVSDVFAIQIFADDDFQLPPVGGVGVVGD
jgi:hypothetical protein